MAATTPRSTQLKLNTGAHMPAMGFGTWQDVNEQEAAVLAALKAGCRHIDTAWVYGTERAVGAAMRKSGIPRNEIFLVTKLWNTRHHPDDVEAACADSLQALDVDYIDLYLMHWPIAFERGDEPFPGKPEGRAREGTDDYVETWKAMEKLYKAGKVRAIGVSNFSQGELERLLRETEVVPAAHQLELHPYLQQKAFAEFHQQHNIVLTAYAPFGNTNPSYGELGHLPKMLDDPVLVEVGKKYNKSPAQVALAWAIAHGISVIPKSKTPARIEANVAGDFALEPADVARIDTLDQKARFNVPWFAKGFTLWEDLDGYQQRP